MSKKNKVEEYETQEALESLDQFAQQTESFFEKNARYFAIGFAALIVLSLGYFVYLKYYLEPIKTETNISLVKSQQLYMSDSVDKALGNEVEGFAYLANEKSDTDAGQIASFMAGSIEYNKGNYQKALDYFNQYDPSDATAKALVLGAKGDCFVQLDKNEDAYKSFKAAIDAADNGGSKFIYTKKAAIVAVELKKNLEALELLTNFKDSYPDTDNTGYIDAEIEKLNASNGN